jgi:S-formylglutathione hydrolase
VLNLISENRAFDGVQAVYLHHSAACNCNATVGLHLPADALQW